MIKSMTGYGRSQQVMNGMDITVEIKSVNHRYFEFSARMPRVYGFLEEKMKSFVQSAVSRGKVDCYIQIETVETPLSVVEVNTALAEGYINALQELEEKFHLRDDISAGLVARYPDVLTVRKAETDEEAIWDAVRQTAQKALDSFIRMRETEGAKLREDILNRSEEILECVKFIEERSPQTVKEYKEKLETRIRELLADAHMDEQRLLTEAAIFADKVAVDEETVRLRSHIEQLHKFLDSENAIGRKMDFLVQEMNREGNTIGSKAQDVAIVRKVVDIKAEIEKIREQVQNIE